MFDLNFYWLVWFAVLLAVLSLAVGVSATLVQDDDDFPDAGMHFDGTWHGRW